MWFKLIKQTFIGSLGFVEPLAGVARIAEISDSEVTDHIKCVSLSNQTCRAKPTPIDVNSNEPLHYPLVISFSKSVGICNTIDDPYAQICVPEKNMDVRAFNLILRENESRFLVQHKLCQCNCRLN